RLERPGRTREREQRNRGEQDFHCRNLRTDQGAAATRAAAATAPCAAARSASRRRMPSAAPNSKVTMPTQTSPINGFVESSTARTSGGAAAPPRAGTTTSAVAALG